MVWKTYLVIYFGTGSMIPSEIEKKIASIGFSGMFGPVDFVYEWQKQPTKEQVFALADKLAKALNGSGAVFNLDTHD